MPWRIAHNVKGCSGYAVVKESDGSVVGCHPNEDKAKAHMRALYANAKSRGGSESMNVFKIFAPTMIASRSADGKLRIEGVASSTVRDHHGDQLTHKALTKMAESARGLTIFLNHKYDIPEDVFGSVERVRLERTGVMDESTNEEIYDLRMGIVVQKMNPRAVAAFESMEAGPDKIPTKLGLSIGAMVPEGGAKFDKTKGGRYIIDDVDLVETSLVSIPANPRSWVDYAVKALAKNLAERNDDLPAQISKQRGALAELMEAEGVQIVDQVDNDDLVEQPTVDEQEQKLGEEGVPLSNDSASDDQDAQAEEHTDVLINEDDATTSPEPTTETLAASVGDPSLQTSRVTVWDGDKVVEVDTGRSKPKDQSAQADNEPENAGSPGTTKSGDPEELALVATLETGDRLLMALQGQLRAARADNDALIEERDAAIELAQKSLEGTQAILTKLSEMPMGRRTGFTDVEEEFVAVRDDIYAADVQKLLFKGTST